MVFVQHWPAPFPFKLTVNTDTTGSGGAENDFDHFTMEQPSILHQATTTNVK